MGDDMQTCANCRCAVPIDDEGGTCSGFPATNPWDWCYEWVEGVPSWAGEGE